MCGRFANNVPAETLIARYQAKMTAAYSENYNIAPTDLAPIVIETKGERDIQMGKFGIPMTMGEKSFPLINIQSEKAAGRKDFSERRCIIPASGFFEWVKVTPKDRQPYYFTPSIDSLFSFAGIWKQVGEGYAFSILTTQANDLVGPIHNRMPVILGHNQFGSWLGGQTPKDELESLMGSYPANLMQVTPVSKAVNNARNKSAECINSA